MAGSTPLSRSSPWIFLRTALRNWLGRGVPEQPPSPYAEDPGPILAEPLPRPPDLPAGAYRRLGRARFTLSRASPSCVAVGPGNDRLATANSWKDIDLFDLPEGRHLKSFERFHEEDLRQMLFLPASDRLAWATGKGEVGVLDVRTGVEIWRRRAFPTERFPHLFRMSLYQSPTGPVLLVAGSHLEALRGDSGEPCREVLPAECFEFEAIPNDRARCQVDPEGQWFLAVAGNRSRIVALGRDGGQAEAWREGVRLELFPGRDPLCLAGRRWGHRGGRRVETREDERPQTRYFPDLLSLPRRRLILSREQGLQLRSWPTPEDPDLELFRELQGDALHLVPSPDERFLVGFDSHREIRRITVWDLDDPTGASLPTGDCLLGPTERVTVSPDSRLVAALGGQRLMIWERESGELLSSFLAGRDCPGLPQDVSRRDPLSSPGLSASPPTGGRSRSTKRGRSPAGGFETWSSWRPARGPAPHPPSPSTGLRSPSSTLRPRGQPPPASPPTAPSWPWVVAMEPSSSPTPGKDASRTRESFGPASAARSEADTTFLPRESGNLPGHQTESGEPLSSFRLPQVLALASSLAVSAPAAPLLMLWGHEPSHCIQGVSEELCEIARISETPKAAEALDRLRSLEARYESDLQQRPAFRSLLFLATEQSLMEANGSGASFDLGDPREVARRDQLVGRAIQAFEEGPYESLPYLPIPLLKVIGPWQHRDPPRHREMVERLARATRAMRRPLDLEAISFLRFLASHLAHHDAPGAVDLLRRTRADLGKAPEERSFAISLLLAEASIRGNEAHWDTFPTQDFGVEQLVQAQVLMHRTPDLPAADFRESFRSGRDWLRFRRTWIKKKGRWNPEVQAKAWQADAMFDLLRRDRPELTRDLR